jgi:hypothetical protein
MDTDNTKVKEPTRAERTEKIIENIFKHFDSHKNEIISASEFKANFKSNDKGAENRGSKYRNILNKYLPSCIAGLKDGCLKNSKDLYIEANTNMGPEVPLEGTMETDENKKKRFEETTKIDKKEFNEFFTKYINKISDDNFPKFEKEVFEAEKEIPEVKDK